MNELIEHARVLRLQPGDVVVVETDSNVDFTPQQMDVLITNFPGHKVLVLQDATLKVVRDEGELAS